MDKELEEWLTKRSDTLPTPTRKDKTMDKDDANSMTVQDVIYALVGQNVAENEVLVSINNSDPYAITDIDVQENPETGNKKVVLLAS